jgi:D-glycero-D-manno-heptose 1,7-bisphosphate phosphatase
VNRRALFLDRDGVINVDRGYLYRREDIEFIDGIFELCRHAKRFGYLIFVVTNQAGIARGFYTERDFWSLTEWMCGVFKDQGTSIDRVYFCPYHPVSGIGKYKIDSPLRKPAPGMILQASQDFSVDLRNSVMIGDKMSDIQAGIAAGIGCNICYRPTSHEPLADAPEPTITTIRTLADAIAFIG